MGQYLASAGLAGDIVAKSLIHGTVGGALSLAQGGSFLQGFAANAIGAGTGLVSNGISGGNIYLDTAIVAAAGGLAAQLTGGKFANGAITAAFANLYNKFGGTLKALTVEGGQDDEFWNIRWKLSEASEQGGFIIQKIEAYVTNLEGNTTLARTYWEAWRINPGDQTVALALGVPYDDHFGDVKNLPAGATFSVNATATFYEGLDKLPSIFSAGSVRDALQLQSTYKDPTSYLTPYTADSTAPYSRTWKPQK